MKMLQEIVVPLLSVNDQSLLIQELSFATGNPVKAGDTIAVLETSKTTYTVEAEADGFIQYFCKSGDELPVNQLLAKIFDLPVVENSSTTKLASMPMSGGQSPRSNKKITEPVFSDAALVLLESLQLNQHDFDGSDFVTTDDVYRKADPSYRNKKNTVTASSPKQKAVTVDPDHGLVDAVKLSSNKLKEISYLSSVQAANLVSVIHTYLELDGVMPFLSKHLHYFKDSVLPIIIFESSRLLVKHPLLNAYFQNDTVYKYKEVNIGFAVDMEKGLKVVKVPQANNKTVNEIENEIIRLSGAYLDDKLELQDLTNVSFTITDLSAEGVGFFQPLINMNNSAILGISSIDKKLNRCTLSLAFDHRVTEGKEAARFLSALKTRVGSFQSFDSLASEKQMRKSAVACHRCLKTLSEDSGTVGFAQCLTPDGEPGYICQACFKGF